MITDPFAAILVLGVAGVGWLTRARFVGTRYEKAHDLMMVSLGVYGLASLVLIAGKALFS